MLAVAAAAWAFWGWAPAPSPRTAEARLAYEEGERSAERRTRESLGQAIAAYERAIALDPTFAPGHAGLADTLVVRGVFGGARPDDSYPRAREAALRAVELDPTLPRVTSRSGTSRSNGIATGAAPSAATAARWRSIQRAARPHALRAVPSAMGRVDESLQESRIAASLKPESPTVGALRAIVLFERGVPRRRSAGPADCPLDPGFSLVHFWQALALADVGRFDEAMTEALASRTGVGNLPVPAVGYIHGRAGRPAEAREVLRALEAARADRSMSRPPTSPSLRSAWAIVRRR